MEVLLLVLAHQRDLLNKLKTGSEIPMFTGGHVRTRPGVKDFQQLPGDLTDDQKIQLLRAKVHGSADRVLDQLLTGNNYNAAARMPLIRKTLVELIILLKFEKDSRTLRETVCKDQRNISKIIFIHGKKLTLVQRLTTTKERRVHELKRGLNCDLATYDNNRRSGDTSIHVHDSHDENLLTVLISTVLDLKNDLAQLINKPAEAKNKDKDMPPTPGRGFDNLRQDGIEEEEAEDEMKEYK